MSHDCYSLDRSDPPSNNSGLGCLLGGCGTAGCALLIGIPLLLVGGLSFLFFLTPIPVNFIAGIIEEDNPNVQIDTISGNLLKGFSIPFVEFPDSNHPERINTLRDINVLYPNLLKGLKSREFDFEEISVGSATLYITYESKTNEKTDGEGKGNDVAAEEETSHSIDSTSGEEWNLFRLRKVDIKNIELIDPDKDFRFTLEELTLDGLEVTPEHFQMGKLIVRSSVFDFSMSPLDLQSGSGFQTSSKLEIHAKLQPSEELYVIKPIELKGNIEFQKKGNVQGTLEGLDGKLALNFIEDKKEVRLKVDELTLSDYFDVEPLLPSKVKWDAILIETEKNVKIADTKVGTFYLGDAWFAVQPGIPENKDVLTAVHQREGDKLTFVLHNKTLVTSQVRAAPFTLTSSKDPSLKQTDILADLFFDSPFGDLELEDQNRILVTLGQPKKVE